jgi:hypothetical protein
MELTVSKEQEWPLLFFLFLRNFKMVEKNMGHSLGETGQ